MDVSLPVEPVYYYECSGGDFRLSYFIPPEELRRLLEGEHISAQVMQDFPDGVDLGCTRPDFDEFERFYGYRPEHDPDALRDAFFALFSSTRSWRQFRGTGYVPRADLEPRLQPVMELLEADRTAEVQSEPLTPALPPAIRRRRMARQARRRAQMVRRLEKMPVKGIDSKCDLHRQKFSSIEQSRGVPAAEVFDALHREQKRGRS